MDRLSDLPDPIRIEIVSYLPTKDAIQITLLTTQWKHICSSLPQLEFTQCLCRSLKDKTYNQNFKNCVDKTLFSHDETDLESLSLRVIIDAEHFSSCDFSNLVPSALNRNLQQFSLYPTSLEPIITSCDLSNWVTSALNHNLQRFSLYPTSREPITLPTKFFEGNTLRYLEFTNFRLRIPSRVSFPNLRNLVLYGVRFFDHNEDDILVNRLFQQSSFPVLEDLEIRNCLHIHTICVSIPSGCAIDICSKTLAFLHSGLFELHPNLNPDASDILFGLCNVETLWLKASFIKCLSDDQLFFGKFPILSATLKHLHLEIYRTEKQTQVISFLIRCFPQLQTLHIYSRYTPEDKVVEDQYGHQSDLYLEDISMFPSLRGIEFKNFGGSEAELDLVHYLLQRASNLMELNIGMKKSQMTVIEKLLALPRSSHHVTLIC